MSSDDQDVMDTNQFDLTIEAIDLAPIPGPRYLDGVSKSLASEEWAEGISMQFPSSGSIVPQLEANRDVEDFVNTVRWLYYLANPEDNGSDIEELDDIPMEDWAKSYKILIHCADGYTESSLLAKPRCRETEFGFSVRASLASENGRFTAQSYTSVYVSWQSGSCKQS